jgi:hypothetical protein
VTPFDDGTWRTTEAFSLPSARTCVAVAATERVALLLTPTHVAEVDLASEALVAMHPLSGARGVAAFGRRAVVHDALGARVLALSPPRKAPARPAPKTVATLIAHADDETAERFEDHLRALLPRYVDAAWALASPRPVAVWSITTALDTQTLWEGLEGTRHRHRHLLRASIPAYRELGLHTVADALEAWPSDDDVERVLVASVAAAREARRAWVCRHADVFTTVVA